MKKSRLLLALPVAMAVLLSACTPSTTTTTSGTSEDSTTTTTTSGGTTTSTPSGPVFDEDHPVEIYFWNTFSYDAQIQNIINRFNEVEPYITVHNVKQSGGYDDLQTMVINGIAASNYPDLVLAYPDHVANYLDYGIAVNMEEYMYDETYGWSSEDLADILPNYLEEGQEYSVPGTYSLPMAKSTEAMFYNEDVLLNNFDLSGIDPTINNGEPLTSEYLNNLTWEELFEKLCPAIVEYNASLPESEKILKTDQDYHAVISYDSDDNFFITLAKQYGIPYTDIDQTTGTGQILFNNPEMKELLKTFNDAHEKGYLISKGSAGGKYTNEYFTVQNLLFSIGSTGGYKYQISSTFNVGVARIPHAEGHDPYVINQGPSVAFLDTKSENTEDRKLATWLFYKFLSNYENSLYWSTETGYMPIRYSVYESDAYIDYTSTEGNPDYSPELLAAKVGSYCETITNDLYVSPVFKGSSMARTQAGSLMTQVLLQPQAQCTDEWLDGIFEKAYNQVLLAMQ